MNKPIVIAGPCSAESEHQINLLMSSLSLIPEVSVFRAGLWKPRSSPGTFEGVGEEGLSWLADAQSHYNIPVATEVILPRHVELCLEYGIKTLWLGARTTVNPFYVEELCSAIQGTGCSLLFKNPINPEEKLWLGTTERILNKVDDAIAIHRGFSVHEFSEYRNDPNWKLQKAFKQAFPEVPLLVDPSHIVGKREGIPDFLTSIPLSDYDGMMIEVHHDPMMALSDAKQQVTPEEMETMARRFVNEFRNERKFTVV